MLRKLTAFIILAASFLLVIGFSNKLYAQQNPVQKKNGRTVVYINLPNVHDTAFFKSVTGDIFPFSNKKASHTDNVSLEKKSAMNRNFRDSSPKESGTGTISIVITTTSSTCGYSAASIVAVASGGTSPYTYSVTGPGYYVVQNTGNFQFLPAGIYQVVATDATGQADTTMVTLVNNFLPPRATISGYQNPSTCSSFDGSLTLTGTDGTPPYLYSVDNINYQANNIFSGLTPGYYSLFVKDANGCYSQTFGFFLGSVANCFGLGFSFTDYICNNDGTIFINGVSGGQAPYQFSLDGINYQSDSTFSNLGTGIHHIYIKDVTGLVEIYSINSSHFCPLIVTDTITDASCGQSDGTLTILPAYGIPPYLYTLDGVNYQSGNVFAGLLPGNYTFTVRDATGVSISDYATINSNCPTVSGSSTDEACELHNGTITAIGSGGKAPYQYSLDGINFQLSNIFSNLSAGNYTVTIKDADGFTDTTTVTINSSCLNLNISVINTVCSISNGSITINAANGIPPYQYSLDGNNFQAGNVFNGLGAGNYKVYIQDAANARRDTDIIITDAPGPNDNVTITEASCKNINGVLKIMGTGGTSPLQYSIDGSNYQSSGIFNALDSGTYIAYVKDANGCINTDTALLTAPPHPVVFIGNDTTLCDGTNLVLTAPQNAGLTYLWQDNTTAYNYTVITPGIYYVKVTNVFSCSASDTIQIKYKKISDFSIGNDTALCTGGAFTLQPLPKITGVYLWSTGVVSPSVSVNAPGLYWLQVKDSGCIKTDSITIISKLSPSVSLGNDTSLCEGTTYLLNASYNNSTYLWQDGSVQPEFLVNKAGKYNVTVDLDGCLAMDTVNIAYISKPQFTLGKDTVICQGSLIVLKPQLNATVNYLWQDGSTGTSYTVKDTGFYRLTASNICGNYSDDIKVTQGLCSLMLPNAFTPNGDGLNDIFRIKYPFGVRSFVFTIYNRFGETVFETTDIAKGWNGTLQGLDQPVGSYVWVIQLTGINNIQQTSKGVVTLIR